MKDFDLERESLMKEIRFSKMKVLIEMLAASVILLIFYSVFFGLKFSLSRDISILVFIPTVFNAVPWLAWLMINYMSFFSMFFRRFNRIDDEKEFYYKDRHLEYEYNLYYFRRFRRLEMLIDISVAIQFIAMVFILAYSFLMFR